MTTVTYREGKTSHPELYPEISNYARKLARAWHQWQAAREIESMPLDVRKDIGWPSADDTDERKAM
ncbi:hypothetical protein ASE04_22340 [Rhizobium sp. Root708]|uniref:hypothetical protein n=1 Tax=Rhizobium sp. Root708 TaxID=1736592 RepID=UPI0006FF7A28|nr:hypothetical protein [Rhizobium sp. Root708]KRB61586.1 hypothetical protein ASE04_22340 [Rhizobium sp. Root708]